MAATRVLPMLALAVILLTGAAATSETFEQSAESRDIDEDFSPAVGVITLDHSNLENVSYYEQVRVVSNVSAGGGNSLLAVEGTDYLWHSNNGTIQVLSGSRLANGGDANIVYGYYVQSGLDQDMANIAAGLIDNSMILVLAGIVGAILIALRGLAS